MFQASLHPMSERTHASEIKVGKPRDSTEASASPHLKRNLHVERNPYLLTGVSIGDISGLFDGPGSHRRELQTGRKHWRSLPLIAATD
jgi:hypothetical protein